MNKHAEMLFADDGASPGGRAAPGNVQSAIDLVHLSKQTFGDHDLQRELLALFDAQAAQFAGRLNEPLGAGDAAGRAALLHTIKGSSRAIGAFEVGRAAEAYEQALPAGDVAGAHERFMHAIESARCAIAHLFSRA